MWNPTTRRQYSRNQSRYETNLTDVITAPMALDVMMNGAAFQAYVQQVPIPTLAPGDAPSDTFMATRRSAAITAHR